MVYSIVKAVLDIADGLGVMVKFCHTGMRSEVGKKVADHLSKGELKQAGQLVELKEGKKMGASKVMKRYLGNIKMYTWVGGS